MQAGYILTGSTEGNTVGEPVDVLGDVGRLVEFGRAIRITCRVFARRILIQVYYCVAQYERNLKAERQVGVQVVLLSTLFSIYQGSKYEDFLKYGSGDTSRSS
jgi:hypothetical protein